MGFFGVGATLRGAIVAILVSAAAIGSAKAQIHLDPAFDHEKMLGPQAAKGAVIWSHGRSVNSEDSLSPTPYYMEVLQQGGWDTYRLDRMRVDDTLENSSRALVRYVHQLKERGYKKVVLTGQSFGGFLSLMAADASDEVHAVVVTAPAAYGSFSEFYGSWRYNATKLYPLIRKIRDARVMMFFFHGDEFDPGGRGEHAEAILTARHLDHLVIDQPPDLTSHWAANTGLFVRRFGSCIRDFIEAKSDAGQVQCNNSWGEQPSAQLPVPPTLVSAPSGGTSLDNPLLGKWYGFYPNGREVLLGVEKLKGDKVTAVYSIGPGVRGKQDAEWVRRQGRVDGDELIFKEKGRNTLRFRLQPDGRLAATWIALDGQSMLEATLHRIN